MVDYLNKHKIKYPESTPENSHFWKEDGIVLQQLLLELGLGYDRLVHSKKFDGNQKWKKTRIKSMHILMYHNTNGKQ